MTEYCTICGEELAPEEEEVGICLSCKLAKSHNIEDVEDLEPDMR